MPVSSPRKMANAIRALSMDAVQQANSGHPGCPMGMADIAQVLWNEFLQFNPKNPNWINRDRFILSNGHGSMLLYSVLHLTGYDLSLEDLKNFRQLGSKTPGHPEFDETPGVETTTGPLGQGLANAVGMALAERQLGLEYNQTDCSIIDHNTYVFLGDGCLMEGISHEACSLAGTLKLGKLIAIYDDNGISIDGEVTDWFTDNTPERFRAYGWQVIDAIDGHSHDSVREAIVQAKKNTSQPTLICCKTTIGFGSPNLAGTAATHGAPLGVDEINHVREKLDWPYKAFEIPEEISQAWDQTQKGAKRELAWQSRWDTYQKLYPEKAAILLQRLSGDITTDVTETLDSLLQSEQKKSAKLATRKASQLCIQTITKKMPELFGGSADLSGSNGTNCKDSKVICAKNQQGNYLHYGVREFAMAAIMNGMALYGGFIPFGGTFLTFVDYQRNALRLAALMKIRSIFVLTHDSIGLGEDGPTHQPIEHLAMLRATPNCHTWRPCDTAETIVSWQAALERQDGPTALILTRQGLEHQKRNKSQLANISKGGYILYESSEDPQIILLSAGSEVDLCMQVAKLAKEKGIEVRVVSMPCQEVFKRQSLDYQEQVLPKSVVHRIAVEAGASMSWHSFVGFDGTVIGLDEFGASAPANDLFKLYGFTKENIFHQVEALLHAAQPA
jgi:transketolase